MSRYACIIILCVLTLGFVSGCATGPHPPRGGQKPAVRELTTTGYCKCKKCCGWKRNWYFRPVAASGPSEGKPKKVGQTASGRKAKPGETIAADTKVYPMRTIMYIPGYGYGRVEDRGGGIKGQHVDLFFKKHKQALEWGRTKKQVKIWLP